MKLNIKIILQGVPKKTQPLGHSVVEPACLVWMKREEEHSRCLGGATSGPRDFAQGTRGPPLYCMTEFHLFLAIFSITVGRILLVFLILTIFSKVCSILASFSEFSLINEFYMFLTIYVFTIGRILTIFSIVCSILASFSGFSLINEFYMFLTIYLFTIGRILTIFSIVCAILASFSGFSLINEFYMVLTI